MPQLVVTIPDFNLQSKWQGYWSMGELEYTASTAASATKPFDLSGLPAGAIITAAVLSATFGSPYTGAMYRRVDGTSFNGTRDVTAKVQAASGSVSFEYYFRANGKAGGDGNHTSTLSFSANTLTITYHMPNSTLTVPASAQAGASITAGIGASSSAYTHRIVYALGNYSDYVDVAAGVASRAFTIPLAWLAAIPNTTSVTATITLQTYSGGTLMGTDTKLMTITVPSSVVPAISALTPVRIDGTVPTAWAVFVKGKSRVRLDITCAGAYGSTITSVAVSGGASGNASLSGGVWSFTSGYLATAGSITFTATVTDSRGRTKVQSVSITVQDYFVPRIASPLIHRCTSSGAADNGGTYLRYIATFQFASVAGKNNVTGRIYYREMPSGGWVDVGALVSGTARVVGGGNINQTKSYEVKIELADAFTTVPFTTDIGTASCLYDAYEDTRFAFFGYAERDGLEVKGNKPFWLYGQSIGVPSNPNLLINGDFQVWLRANVFVLTDGSQIYTVDRWAAAGIHMTVAKNPAGGLVFSKPSTNSQAFMRYKDERGYEFFIGKTMTASISVDGIVYSRAFAISAGTCFGFDLGTKTWAPTATGSLALVQIRHVQSVNFSCIIDWVKLEFGEVSTPHIPRPFGAESVACQRYFQTGYGVYVAHCSWITTGLDVAIQLPVPMRIAPTITINGYDTDNTWKYYFNSGYRKMQGLTPITDRGDTRHVMLRFSTLEDVLSLYSHYQCRGKWFADAEIH